MNKNKVCRVCYQPFAGRRDARTCSPRCRKRLQRTREELVGQTASAADFYVELEQIEQSGRRLSRLTSISRLKGLLLAALAMLFALVPASPVLADDIPTAYRTRDTSLVLGMAVSLTEEKEGDQLLIKAADSNDSTNALGVVVGLADSLIASSSISQGVYVSTAGPAKVYVSDLNGVPEPGDLLALSPLKGILMRSSEDTKPTFGSAIDNFDVLGAKSVNIKGNNGEVLKTNVAMMNASVSVNPPLAGDPSTRDNWLQATAASLTGRDLSSLRIIAVLLVFVTMMIIAGEIIYSVVTGSIRAVGRNPLARGAIARQSLRSFGLSGLVLAAGISIIVMLIWL